MRRSLVVDLSGAQCLDPAAAAMAQLTGELGAALLRVPGLVRALLLNPALPLPGSLHRDLLSSPLLGWNSASALRRAAAEGPIAYLVPVPPGLEPGTTLLPQAVAEREIPLVMVWHGGRLLSDDARGRGPVALSQAALELYRHADLVLSTETAGHNDVEAWSLHPARVLDLVTAGRNEPSATEIVAGVLAAMDRLATAPGPWSLSGEGGRGSGRMHLALVAALPPSPAPSAPWSAALADALAGRCRLDVFSDGPRDDAWLDRLGARCLPVAALARHGLAPSYDAVVHVVGSAADDLPALRSARRVPGVVWFHDLHLAEPHRAEAATAPELAAVLRRVVADRAPAPVVEALERGDAGAFDAVAERRYGLLLTGEVMREARAAVVGSNVQARRLRLDQGASAPCPPIWVIDPRDPSMAAARLLEFVRELATTAPPHSETAA